MIRATTASSLSPLKALYIWGSAILGGGLNSSIYYSSSSIIKSTLSSSVGGSNSSFVAFSLQFEQQTTPPIKF